MYRSVSRFDRCQEAAGRINAYAPTRIRANRKRICLWASSYMSVCGAYALTVVFVGFRVLYGTPCLRAYAPRF